MRTSTHAGLSCPPAAVRRFSPPSRCGLVPGPAVPSRFVGVGHISGCSRATAIASSSSVDRAGFQYRFACGPRWIPSRAVGVGQGRIRHEPEPVPSVRGTKG